MISLSIHENKKKLTNQTDQTWLNQYKITMEKKHNEPDHEIILESGNVFIMETLFFSLSKSEWFHYPFKHTQK
jgi:hypothetical protein